MAAQNAISNRATVPDAGGSSSTFFQRASDTDARYGTFTDASGNATVIQYITNNGQAEASLFQTLVARIVPGAAYDSSQHEYAPSCLPDTRTGILETMMEWADKNDSCPIFWLSGPAGSGKSAIAHTFAKECDGKKILAGSFFFLRGDKFRSGYSDFFLTLAYQLAMSVPSMRASMQKGLKDHPAISTKILEKQFEMLIRDPILALKQPISPMIVVVDALDECENKDGVLKLVSIISKAHHMRSFPLRFVFTSRAYDHFNETFRDPTTGPLTIRSNLQDWKADDDIHRVLRARFRDIRRKKKRVMEQVPESWPSDADLDLAVVKSEGLFIWAETLLRFVGSDWGLPQDKLQSALKLHPGLDPLYQQVILYRQVYRQAILDAPLDELFERVIGAVPLLRIRLSAEQLGQLLGRRINEIRNAFLGLEPILNIPEEADKAIEPYHASLHDFLTDRDRSGDLCINPEKQHGFIMLHCLRIVVGYRQGNVIHREVADYACTNLFHHFRYALAHEGKDNSFPLQSDDFLENLRILDSQSFKHWFETVHRRNQLLESRRDLGVTISELKHLPQKPLKLIRRFKAIKQHMFKTVKDMANEKQEQRLLELQLLLKERRREQEELEERERLLEAGQEQGLLRLQRQGEELRERRLELLREREELLDRRELGQQQLFPFLEEFTEPNMEKIKEFIHDLF